MLPKQKFSAIIISLVAATFATMLTIQFLGGNSLAAQDSSALVQGRLESGYDYVGYLISDKEKVCAATLIDADTIVTAAHCLSFSAGDKFSFGVGKFNPDTSNLATVVLVKFAQDYDPHLNSGVDLAVAKLSKKFQLNQYAQIAPSTGYGNSCTASIVAYGAGIQSGVATSDLFLKKSGEGCTQLNGATFLISFNKSVGMCYGDSGGPIFVSHVSNQLLGVLSGGLVDKDLNSIRCDAGNVGIATTASSYSALLTADFSSSSNFRVLASGNVTNFETQFQQGVASLAQGVPQPTTTAAATTTNNLGLAGLGTNLLLYVATFVVALVCIYFLTKPLQI